MRTDQEIIDLIIRGDETVIREFFFVRMREAFAYIGQFFSPDPVTAEDVISEAYIVLSANDWHKLRIFKGTCSLKTYVTLIVARHFQHKRNILVGVDDNVLNILSDGSPDSEYTFVMEDVNEIISRFKPIDRLLIQRLMIDGEKPRDILDEVRALSSSEEDSTIAEHDDEKLAGYVYVRYNRAKDRFRKKMEAVGYGR